MKTAVSLTLIVLGTMLVAMPLFLSFLLHAFSAFSVHGEFDRKVFDVGQQVACWVPGGLMLLIGIVSALFSRRAEAKPPKLPN